METPKTHPLSIGVIMDGNRRYAKANGLPSFEGHRLGYEKLREFISWGKEAGVKYITVYAFSTENWNRSTEEVGFLMKLLGKIVEEIGREAVEKDVRLIFIGETSHVSPSIVKSMRNVEETTKDCKTMTLTIAISYGGRQEIVDTIKRIPENERASLTEERFSKLLWTKDVADPDIIIRTGGEKRLSNFLTWQSVYSEFFFTKTFWPEFSKEEFFDILAEFNTRERRFGK